MLKKYAVFAAFIAVIFTACGSSDKKIMIGVSMPTELSQRWILDGESIKKNLESMGYKVELSYAQDNVSTQITQIDNLITKGAKALIIAPVSEKSLTTILNKAREAGIRIIAYDRLIRDTSIDYYVSFDNYDVGRQMGDIIVKGLNLEKQKGPFYIELFAGSLEDNNAYFFYNGAMDILTPYIKKGVLIIGSGQEKINVIETPRWDGEFAQKRLESLLAAFYKNKRLDAVLSPFDEISLWIIPTLKEAGYGTSKNPMPIIGGQDANPASIKEIIIGEQYATIFKDTRKLGEAAAQMTDAVLKGEDVQVNNTKDYNNGIKIVPSYLLKSIIIYKDNVEKELIDTGYYKKADIGL
jgi:putative multiple sugar transport system substrate-binding protein